MAILKKHKQAVISEHVDEDTGNFITVRKWLTRVYKVIDIDNSDDKTNYWIIDGECKLIYTYLFNFGKCHGWGNIYPNQSLMCSELGIPKRTFQRKIKILGDSGLIDIIKVKNKSLFWSNRYRVQRPVSIGRRKWIDVDGVHLVGKLYQFDSSIFKRS